MDETHDTVPGTRAAVAAGALFVDDAGRVLLIRPSYKPYWDVPGGYVEPGESPRQACVREVAEELAITPEIGPLVAVDWAPHPAEGDKVLFLFDGGSLSAAQKAQITFEDGELAEYRFVSADQLADLTIPRL
ncbi:MAG TPA: NUDIX hydrolase, partial [Cryptosporangiaceae bacterium]|nr:NUDIX hydrolase [Cryptosporangiaceae bacterium]